MKGVETGCVYALTDPESGEPRYIGATTDPINRLKSHRSTPHSEDLEREYSDETEAVEKMLAHTDIYDHGAAVKEVRT